MWCGLCGFLIIKLQIALLHAVWCDVVHCYLRYNVVMPFCRQFWCDLCGLCGLVNTPTLAYPTVDMMSLCLMLFWRSNTIILLIWTHNINVPRTVIPLPPRPPHPTPPHPQKKKEKKKIPPPTTFLNQSYIQCLIFFLCFWTSAIHSTLLVIGTYIDFFFSKKFVVGF